ncbi:hypothetical protein BGZ60DRAFT_528876 [Tricladium varicosporioides]|nr:hypothetical protein BGZ60DRAFT_528876 [Hymenoscyphus varicosporioides]
MYTTSLSFASMALLASNAVLSSASTLAPRVGAGKINGMTYISCQSDSSIHGFNARSYGFATKESTPSMNARLCTAICTVNPGIYNYAAVRDDACECGVNFGAWSSIDDDKCNLPCPGNNGISSSETCGGLDSTSAQWWSLYALDSVLSSPTAPKTLSTSTSSVPVASPSSSTKPAGNATSTAAPEMTTSTVYSTRVFTVTSCAPTITNCPATVKTEIISLYTTVCPVATTSASVSSLKPSSSTTPATVTPKSTNSTTIPTIPVVPATTPVVPKQSTSTSIATIKTTSLSISANSTTKATGSVVTPSTVPFKGAAENLSVERFGLAGLLLGLVAFVL